MSHGNMCPMHNHLVSTQQNQACNSVETMFRNHHSQAASLEWHWRNSQRSSTQMNKWKTEGCNRMVALPHASSWGDRTRNEVGRRTPANNDHVYSKHVYMMYSLPSVTANCGDSWKFSSSSFCIFQGQCACMNFVCMICTEQKEKSTRDEGWPSDSQMSQSKCMYVGMSMYVPTYVYEDTLKPPLLCVTPRCPIFVKRDGKSQRRGIDDDVEDGREARLHCVAHAFNRRGKDRAWHDRTYVTSAHALNRRRKDRTDKPAPSAKNGQGKRGRRPGKHPDAPTRPFGNDGGNQKEEQKQTQMGPPMLNATQCLRGNATGHVITVPGTALRRWGANFEESAPSSMRKLAWQTMEVHAFAQSTFGVQIPSLQDGCR